jgi:hypothetical protein
LRKRPQDPEGFPKALAVSAVTGAGLEEAWAEMQALARQPQHGAVGERAQEERCGADPFRDHSRTRQPLRGPRAMAVE